VVGTPATALNIVVLFIGKYFTHAGTVISGPGASSTQQFLMTFTGRLLPGSGLVHSCVVYK
jgi:hypothetical protein